MSEFHEDKRADVIIVGAGAAGLMTAIITARAAPHLRVVALEGARKVGAKILVSGGGRCNVTNVTVKPADFYGGNQNVIKNVLAAFDENATVSFFKELDVELHEEEFGKLFPNSGSARTVVNGLLAEAERHAVGILTGHRVSSIATASTTDGFSLTVTTEGNIVPEEWHARCVVLATGGRSLPKTGSDGRGYAFAESLRHRLVETTPALDPILLDGTFHGPLSGISHEMLLTLQAEGWKPVRIQGPALWTHFGLSGPTPLNMSRFWNRAVLEARAPRLYLNFVSGLEFADVEKHLLVQAKDRPKTTITVALRHWLPARVAEALVQHAGIPPRIELGSLGRDQRRTVVHSLTALPLAVTGSRGYRFAEVTAGGVSLKDINPKSMESRKTPGLFLVGEILDVDGRIGGFNFQWAWASGYVAGMALARSLSKE